MTSTQENIAAPELSGSELSGPVKARLKWFNAPKGFGFVNPEDKQDVDAFLHITKLQNIGIQTLGEGACLLCQIEYGDKGAHVKQVLEVLDEGTLPEAGKPMTPSNDLDNTQTWKMHGIVKWYKEDQGFGFIVPEDNQKDVFIHKTCLDKHDIDTLEPGQKIFMTFRAVPKGREVVSFEILEKN